MGDNLQEMVSLSETEKQQEMDDLQQLDKDVNKMIATAKDTVKSLRKAADHLDEVWKDCKIAHATGTTAGIVGGVLTIGGGIATMTTAGAATPLLLLGMGVGAAGAGTNLVATFIEAAINSSDIQKAEKELKETHDKINKVNDTIRLWQQRKEYARLVYIAYLTQHTARFSEPIINILRPLALRFVGLPADVVQQLAQTGVQGAGARAAGELGEDVAQAGAQAGAREQAKLAGGLIVGVSAAFLVWDAIDLGFTIRDLVENKGSEAARALREKANELEKGIEKLTKKN